MKSVLTSKAAVTALILNLALGNFILLTGNHMRWNPAMQIGPSIGAAFVLLAGFKRAERLRKGWQAAFLGLGCTLLAPIAGMFLAGLAMALQQEESPGAVLGKALLTAVLFGGMGGWWFTPPFLLFNMPAFYLHWRASGEERQ